MHHFTTPPRPQQPFHVPRIAWWLVAATAVVAVFTRAMELGWLA